MHSGHRVVLSKAVYGFLSLSFAVMARVLAMLASGVPRLELHCPFQNANADIASGDGQANAC